MADITFGAPVPPVEADGPKRLVIPPGRYTSSAFLELERARMWPRVWLVAGFACDVEKPGDWFVYELGWESILVTRDQRGQVAAFHNVCLHRGHTLCDPGKGNCKSFVCPYHAWEWGVDGNLDSVPHGSRFPQGFPEDKRRLAPVACRVWAGLIWIRIGGGGAHADAGPTLEEYLGSIHECVGAYHADELQMNMDWTAEWPCNWKTALDGFNETYHGPATHPQFGEFLDTWSANFQFSERHSVFIIKHGHRPPGVGESPDDVEIGEPMASQLRAVGADPKALRGRPDEARAILQQRLRDACREAGHHVEALSDEQLTDTHHFYVFPNTHIDFHGANDLTVQRFRPHPTDPNRCFVDVTDFKRLKRDQRGGRPAHQHIPPGAPQRGIVYAQDIERLSRVQRGMHSSGYPGPQLSNQERRLYHMHTVIDQYVGAEAAGPLRVTVEQP